MKDLKRVLFVALMLVISSPFLAMAQGHPAGGPGMRGGDPAVHERYLEVRAQVLRTQVGLDEATARKVEAVMDDFDATRQDLKAQLRKDRQALQYLLNTDSNDQKAYEKALNSLLETQTKLHNLRQDEMESLKPLMTPKQQAKLLQVMQEMRRKAGGKGGPGGMHGGQGMDDMP